MISFILLIIIMAVVYAIAYRRGRTIKERELVDMVEPTVNKFENEYQEYLKLCKLFDQMMTDDDFFSDDIAESSKTDTNKNELK